MKRGNWDPKTDAHSGECHVKVAIMWPQVKELPETRERGRTDSSLAPSQVTWPY